MGVVLMQCKCVGFDAFSPKIDIEIICLYALWNVTIINGYYCGIKYPMLQYQ